MDEYLQGLFERAYDREVAQEEHVISSSPFFVAALALTVTVLGLIVNQLPTFTWNLYCVFIYSLMSLSGLTMTFVLFCLLFAVWPRDFRVPPKETEIQEWATGLRDYYFEKGLRGDRLDSTVEREVRRWMVGEFAEATIQNRSNHAFRKAARTQGLLAIVFAMVLAFGAVGTIFVHDRVLTPLGVVSAPHAAAPSARIVPSSKLRTVSQHAAARTNAATNTVP